MTAPNEEEWEKIKTTLERKVEEAREILAFTTGRDYWMGRRDACMDISDFIYWWENERK